MFDFLKQFECYLIIVIVIAYQTSGKEGEIHPLLLQCGVT